MNWDYHMAQYWKHSNSETNTGDTQRGGFDDIETEATYLLQHRERPFTMVAKHYTPLKLVSRNGRDLEQFVAREERRQALGGDEGPHCNLRGKLVN